MLNKKLEIYSNKISIDFVKNFFKIFPNNLPNYFKDIPKNCPFSRFKFNNTLRTCSGIINYYKKAIVFLSPFDIEFVIENDQVFIKFGSVNFDGAMIHPNDQFLNYVKNKKYLCVSKLMFGIFLKSNVPLLITNPTWALNNFEILPGIINAETAMELNLFIPIKKEDKNIFIRQNTPLCIIHMETDKNIDIVFNKNKYDSSSENGLLYIFSSLKNKLLKNKYSFK
jgi:hypothetical protein